MNRLVESELMSSADTISRIDSEQILKIADVLTDIIKKGGQVIFMGNGGSSADAQHIAAEFSGRYLLERPAMPGVCLSNIAPVTAIGNDYSYDTVFARQVEAFARKGDAVIGISTSGNSKNIIAAFEKAKDMGVTTISFTGSGGKLKDMADHALIIDSVATPRIQEAYMVAGHTICGLVERGVYGKKAVFIDRDDTIAKDVPYCSRPEDLHLFDGVPEAIADLNDAGYLVIMVTNQSGIARGKLDEATLERIHEKMNDDIAKKGGRIDSIYHCPHHPDEGCGCRKPEIGMGLKAISDLGINTRESFMVGNSESDMGFGRDLGCRCIMVTDERSFADAVKEILGN